MRKHDPAETTGRLEWMPQANQDIGDGWSALRLDEERRELLLTDGKSVVAIDPWRLWAQINFAGVKR